MLRKLNELTKKKIVHEIFVNGAFFQKSHAKKKTKNVFCFSLFFAVRCFFCTKVTVIAKRYITLLLLQLLFLNL